MAIGQKLAKALLLVVNMTRKKLLIVALMRYQIGGMIVIVSNTISRINHVMDTTCEENVITNACGTSSCNELNNGASL